ncbi:MAG: phage terminase large subunit [Anaerolineaceae bacterium]|nr:phage terminase large subunit [Anaerolineaceae bacterium]
MTPVEIADCRADLLTFTQTMFHARKGVPMKPNWHQGAICNALERVVLGDIIRLIINIPPRSGKTELAVINFIAWCMGNFPESEFIHASYSKRLATNNTYNARAVMQHEKFATIFGEPDFRGDSNAKDEFRTGAGGIVYATGADGTITGYGAGGMGDQFKGAIIIDDPHKAGEGSSDTMRQNVIDWFSTTMESRKNNPNTPIIVIMQRLHENDLSGFLLAGGNGEKWEHLNIPAVADGESFWPDQFPIEDLKRLEKTNTYRYAGQYMQNPAPIGGGIFKTKWWNFYTVLPVIKHRLIFADTAQKTKEQNDFSVFQCWGLGADDRIYLLDMVRGKWEAPQLLLQARAFWQKHHGRSSGMGTLRKMMIEDKSSGTGLIQQLRPGVPVEGIPRSIDKVSRAMDVVPQIEVGNVVLPDPSLAPWLSDILAEAEQFPNGTHDDTIDPLMDAIQCMLIEKSTINYGKLL